LFAYFNVTCKANSFSQINPRDTPDYTDLFISGIIPLNLDNLLYLTIYNEVVLALVASHWSHIDVS